MATYDFPHRGRAQTARIMYWLAENFPDDLGFLSGLRFADFHDWVRRIPYINDENALNDPQMELIARPGYLLGMAKSPGLDCKKKAILIGAWAEKNNVPWDLVGMSEQANKEIHHVFPLLWTGRAWMNADATYPTYKLGAAKPEITYGERFPR